METLAFSVVAACALLSAIAVVRSLDLVHAVLWLGVTLFATAALYAMLGASFIAGVQVLLYVGGVITLMIIGVMMTRRQSGAAARLERRWSEPAALAALAIFGTVTWAVVATDGLDAPAPPPAPSAADLGRALLHDHLLAFETVSMLLLAAMVGAIVISRRRDPGAVAKRPPVRAASASPVAPATSAEAAE
jgi:NADH-quinone oxidoreductase subunit J